MAVPQDKVLPQLKQQLADTKGLFKDKEGGYPGVQILMRTFREMESVVEQYNRDFAEWEYQISRKPTAADKEQRRQPEKQSVLKRLRRYRNATSRNRRKTA